MYWILNIISGFMEIGIVLFGMQYGGIVGGLIGALCYQIGNMVPDPLRLSKKACWLLLLIAIVCNIGAVFDWRFVLLAIPVLTMVLQGIRSDYKSAKSIQDINEKSKVFKRFTRIIGFALGTLFNQYTLLACLVCIAIAQYSKNTEQKMSWKLECFNRYDIILFVHEMHYFVYCYCMLLIMNQKYGKGIAGALFFLSWILYIISPGIYEKFNMKDYKKTFLVGHSLLLVILTLIIINSNIYIQIMLWIFTGIGGTTEYCIGRLEKEKKCYSTQGHNAAENLGHVAGVIVSIVLYLLIGKLWVSVAAAIMFVAIALGLMIARMKEVEYYEDK